MNDPISFNLGTRLCLPQLKLIWSNPNPASGFYSKSIEIENFRWQTSKYSMPNVPPILFLVYEVAPDMGMRITPISFNHLCYINKMRTVLVHVTKNRETDLYTYKVAIDIGGTVSYENYHNEMPLYIYAYEPDL